MKLTNRLGLFRGIFVAISIIVIVFAFPSQSLALSWTQVVSDGFGDTNNRTIVDVVEFNSQLYASIGNIVDGTRIYRSANGTTWTKVNTDGFGNAVFSQSRLAVLGSELYASVAETTAPAQFQVWKTSNGTTWTQVGTDGFGDVTNFYAGGLFAWQGSIYVGTWNPVTGAEVWQVTPSGAVTQVNTDGFGAGAANDSVVQFADFNGYLYTSTTNVGGTQLWRTNNSTTWTQVEDNGFGDAANIRVESFFVFGGYLYAGTINPNGCQLWRTANGTTWSVVDNTGFGDADNTWVGPNAAIVNGVIYLGLRNAVDGARLIYSTNGTTWTQEGTDGFGGGVNNFAFYALTYNGYLYLGVSNAGADGIEIWRTGDLDPLAITTESLPEGTKSTEYSQTLATANGTAPFVWNQTGDLPDGITLDTSTGRFSGTPTETGEFRVVVSVTDGGAPMQLASREYTLKIIAATTSSEVLPETGSNANFILTVQKAINF